MSSILLPSRSATVDFFVQETAALAVGLVSGTCASLALKVHIVAGIIAGTLSAGVFPPVYKTVMTISPCHRVFSHITATLFSCFAAFEMGKASLKLATIKLRPEEFNALEGLSAAFAIPLMITLAFVKKVWDEGYCRTTHVIRLSEANPPIVVIKSAASSEDDYPL